MRQLAAMVTVQRGLAQRIVAPPHGLIKIGTHSTMESPAGTHERKPMRQCALQANGFSGAAAARSRMQWRGPVCRRMLTASKSRRAGSSTMCAAQRIAISHSRCTHSRSSTTGVFPWMHHSTTAAVCCVKFDLPSSTAQLALVWLWSYTVVHFAVQCLPRTTAYCGRIPQ